MSCFLMERLHKRAKRFMLGRMNTKAYERGILSDITLRHLSDLQETWDKPSVYNPHQANHDIAEIVRVTFPQAKNIFEGPSCRTPKGTQVFRGDTIMYSGGRAGKVCYVFDVDDVVYVSVLKLVHRGTTGYTSTFKISDDMVMVSLNDIVAVVTQKTMGNSLIVLLPVSLRR